MFYCREGELSALNKRFLGDRFEFVIIYGRRRVGKTALINEFCKDKRVVYCSALDAASQENLRALSKAIHACKEPASDLSPDYRSFDDAFNEIGRMAANERLVFVIDEYPYLAKAAPSISSVLQHLIDRAWGESKLYLILCGSSMSFMERQVLGYESPLYGRRTAQLKVMPLNYKETAVFNPDLSNEQNALVYGITGGIPHYINKLDVRGDLDEALITNLFDRSSYLFEEPENLLKQELREPAAYNSIITTIAEGASRMNEISTKTGIETGPCSKYLKTLIYLGIVKKHTPITEKPGKRTIYMLSDNFFRFWYRYVPQNIGAISSGRILKLYEKAVKSDISNFMGEVFEKMCREYLMYYAEDLPFAVNEVGQWWGTAAARRKQIQIDIVAPDADKKKFVIGSCKFRNEPVGMDELALMRDYAASFRRGAEFYYYFFSKGGFTRGLKEAADKGEAALFSLDDLFDTRG